MSFAPQTFSLNPVGQFTVSEDGGSTHITFTSPQSTDPTKRCPQLVFLQTEYNAFFNSAENRLEITTGNYGTIISKRIEALVDTGQNPVPKDTGDRIEETLNRYRTLGPNRPSGPDKPRL